jgi:hypothetical protein
MAVHLIEAEHWSVPGLMVKICATEEIAQREALSVLNLMRDDVDLGAATDFEAGMEELTEAVQDKFGAGEDFYISVSDHELINV